MGYPSLNKTLTLNNAVSGLTAAIATVAGAENNIDFYANMASFPVTGVTERIYVDLATGRNYRWTGSIYYDFSSNKEDRNVIITNLTISAGIVTVDLSTVTRVMMLNMTENVTGWNFINAPATNTVLELTLIWKQHPTNFYSCASPATKTAGGVWQQPLVVGAIETLGMLIIDGTDRYVYPSTAML